MTANGQKPANERIELDLPSDWEQDTFEQRRDRLQRRVRQVVAVGVTLTAFVLALAASAAAGLVYQRVPFWVASMVFTIIVLAGASLGQAYIRYENEVSTLERAIAQNPAPTQRPGERWPESADRFWNAALLLTVLAPLAFLVASWWAAIDAAKGR
ncbi:MAG TPA: hypothetical protein VEL03_15305 [Streptosporangiaceae bacterium]|nr:hypothetical protein [Streptosporangiaceae bacterium]